MTVNGPDIRIMAGMHVLVILIMSVTQLHAENVASVKLKLAAVKELFNEKDLATAGLDEMAKTFETTPDKPEAEWEKTITNSGAALEATIDFMTALKNGEFKGDDGGKKAAVGIVKLIGKFAEIGGKYLPPPAGSAINVAFGTINKIMSLIGVDPEAPDMRTVMKELLDEQTEEIRGMFEDLKEVLVWDNIKDEADGEIDNFVLTHSFLRSLLKTGLTQNELQSTLCNLPIIQGNKFLAKLENHLEEECSSMKGSKGEDRCVLLLEFYSRIATMRSSQFDMLIEVSGIHYQNLPLAYRTIAKDSLLKIKDTLTKVTAGKKHSAICLRTKLATFAEDELIFTTSAMKMVNVSYELSEIEKSITHLICPSATKLMLIAGEDGASWTSVELVSPFTKCPAKFPSLPEFRDDYPMAAVYNTSQGEKRVFVCGGDWSKYKYRNVQKKCWSAGSAGNWSEEASLVTAVAFGGMASVNRSIYVLGGATKGGYESSIQEFQHHSNTTNTTTFSGPYAGYQCSIAFEDTLYTASAYTDSYSDSDNLTAYSASVTEKTWNKLPNTTNAAYRCTVAIISGHPVWVLSDFDGETSYLSLPHTPGAKWTSLPKTPGKCAGLGWSEGRLTCADSENKHIHYYEEKTGETQAKWVTTTHKMQRARTYSDNAYATVPGSWGCE